ncbi:hypothetical protein E3E22_09320 [Thermococcus sp. MV5]|uniref:right-handed parallel beta-helix repeat-containing protein n=1 Tax=Thermococcus sp. MV5 TaxID=1638272 RepID=UPI00143CB96C|nr:NosD domain-containing protein [Thermococcus sp. MV5]NJE26807.1 hypothetical protein [Thermococcus sp. MV5]
MRILVIFVILLFVPFANATQLAFIGDESLKELPGSGILEDPYVLENLIINASNITGILVKNTTAYLLIRNLTIIGNNKRPGIILENVKNVRIEDVQVIRCSYGIRIVNSENITIVNSIFKGNLYCYWKSEFAGDADCKGGAIFADYSTNLYIINNSFVPHSYLFSNIYGVYLVMVENSIVYGNRFVSSIKCYPSAAFGGYCKGTAIYLDRSNNNELTRNTIYLPSSGGMEYAAEVYGMYISGHNNTIYLNNFYGEQKPSQPSEGIGFFYLYHTGENIFHSPKVIYRFGNETFEGFLGNYWATYNGSDENGDGLIEWPFKVDKYPLVLPSENYEIIKLAEESKTSTTPLNNLTNSPTTPSFPQENGEFKYFFPILAVLAILIILWRWK